MSYYIIAFCCREDKLTHIEKAISAELGQAKKVIEEKIPFNDLSKLYCDLIG